MFPKAEGQREYSRSGHAESARLIGGSVSHREWFGPFVERLEAAGVKFTIEGSWAVGQADVLSDLDVRVKDSPDARAAVLRGFNDVGRRIALYDAAHIGKSSIWVWYCAVGECIRKIDVEFLVETTVPWDGLVISELLEKAVAWQWFFGWRVARGEYFAASRSIDSYRENLVLPVIRRQIGASDLNCGHRHAERDLAGRPLQSLLQTHPSSLERESLIEAFSNLVELFVVSLAELPESYGAVPRGATQGLLRARAEVLRMLRTGSGGSPARDG